MKLTRLGILATAMFTLTLGGSPALAGGDAGCGLGSILWKGQSGMAFNLFASTTNSFLGTQTLGITFGTSGCKRGEVVAMEHQLELFVAANADGLARDMALGEGERLEMLASLLAVAEPDREAFYTLTQQNFAAIFSSEEVTAPDVIGAVRGLMEASPTLGVYVGS